MTTFTKLDEKNFTIRFVTSEYAKISRNCSTKNEHIGMNWYLTAHSTIGKNKADTLSIYLCCDGNGSTLWNVDVLATFKLIKNDGSVARVKSFTSISRYKNINNGFGFTAFIPISKLAPFIDNGNITIECLAKVEPISGVSLKRKQNFDVKDPKLSNIVLKVDGKDFHVNGGLIAAHSKVLRELIYPLGINRKTRNYQYVKDVKPEEFEQFLQCIYQLPDINKDNVANLLKLSDRFEAEVVKDQCERFLISTSDVSKLDKLKYAETHIFPDLQVSVLNSIKESAEVQKLCQQEGRLGEATVRALLKKASDVMKEMRP